MASINWVILQPNSLNPTPLPHEKILLTTRSVSLSLFPSIPGAPLSQSPDPKKEFKSQGTTHVTNQRVIFVADGAHSASSLASGSASVVGAAGIPTKLELQTLSAPYSHFLDGRYVQPWFAATYYEALVLPASGGGLEGPHIVRLSFKESGGASFFELVQEMKERLGVSGGRSAVVEPLPRLVCLDFGTVLAGRCISLVDEKMRIRESQNLSKWTEEEGECVAEEEECFCEEELEDWWLEAEADFEEGTAFAEEDALAEEATFEDAEDDRWREELDGWAALDEWTELEGWAEEWIELDEWAKEWTELEDER
ncbi:hypothetical protein P7C70_g3185, partial [Phenoliferia sp. Uapishka_3]